MKDRFTWWLVLLVAFGGGLAAMVFVAGWRPDESKAPAVETSTTAQVVPDPRTEPVEVDPPKPASTGVKPSAPSRQHDVPDAPGVRHETPEAPRPVDPYPAEAGGSPPAPQQNERATRGAAAASPRDSPRFDPEPSRPRDGASPPPQGGAGQTSGTPGSATRSPSGREMSSAPKSLYLNSAQGGSRSSPRSQSEEKLLDPPSADPADVPSLADQDHVFEDGSDSGPNSPWSDDTQDEPDQDQDQDPDQDQEPEAPPAVVRLAPAQSEFAVDEIVPVTVEIMSGTDVGHVPFYVDFDPRVLRFARGEEGSFLGLDGVQTMFVATQSSGGDAVVVGLSRLGQHPGIDGNGLLCVLYFEAVAPGTSDLRFKRANVKDSTNRPVPASFVHTAVTVTVR